MRARLLIVLLSGSLLAACSVQHETSGSASSTSGRGGALAPVDPADRPVQVASPAKTIRDFTSAATAARSSIDIPRFETTPDEIVASVERAIATADAELERFTRQDPRSVTFESTVGELDDIIYPVVTVTNRIYLIKETNPDRAVREAATEEVNRLQDWFVGLQYREDVYNIVKAFADRYEAGRGTRLRGEDKKLFEDTMRDYRRAGLALDAETRARVEDLRKQLARLETEFNTNITNANVTLPLTAEQVEGVPEDFLRNLPQEDGAYLFKPTIITHFLAVMMNAKAEETRKAMKTARFSVAMEENTPVLNEMVRLRSEIAGILGYDDWADFQCEPKMAKTGDRAMAFLEELREALDVKFQEEKAEMRAMKIADTGNRDAQMEIWDWRYYENQLKKERFDVDVEALRAFFPLERSLAGMFNVYEQIFGLRFDQIENPQPWAEGVTLYAVTDARTNEPMGLFYLDMFPREGKYNHFAQFGIIDGKIMDNGVYQRPTVALVCNFTPPTDDKPSLLSHSELETLFHEFGHAMHSILTRAKYVAYSGTSVPRDFVEAPSQMFENWCWDKGVLDTFAADYRDPSRKIDPDLLERMEEAKLATIASFYRRQLALGMSDLRMHMQEGETRDAGEITNETFEEVFFAPPANTSFACYWGHLAGYDAGYYGYAWADAIAADMATKFFEAPGGLMDRNIGMRLRNEVYSVGGARDAEESIRQFLGRERSSDAFYKTLGLTRHGNARSSH